MFESVRLQNFRSYSDSHFKLIPGVNVVYGPNASGKTNLLESVLILCRGKSYRNRLGQTIQRGKNWARVDGDLNDSHRTLKIKDAAEFTVDAKNYSRLPASHQLPVVLFEPNHLLLLTGEPSRRRDWLDNLLESTNPLYKKTIASYRRSLAQRNSLLKKPEHHIKQQIFAWDVRLSELAGVVVSARQQLITNINKAINKPYRHLAGGRQTIKLEYLASFPVESYSTKMLAGLGRELHQDVARGFTAIGPHREDFETYLNKRLIVEAGSRGEIRSSLIALKLFEKSQLEVYSQQKPLLLLDDVFSELDSSRRAALVDYLKDHQTIITTTDADLTRKYFKRSHLIKLS